MRRTIALILTLTLLCCFMASCGDRNGGTKTITDLNGDTVAIPSNPERIVCRSGNGTSFLIGMGYADTIKDHHNRNLEECRALGINDSMIHEDFMIGCDTMNIDAICADGSTVAIFRNGNWAF